MNCRSLTETDRDVAEAECMAEAVKPRRSKAKASRTKGKVRMLSLPCEPSARRASCGVPWGRALRAAWLSPCPDFTGLFLFFTHFLGFPRQRLASCAEAGFSPFAPSFTSYPILCNTGTFQVLEMLRDPTSFAWEVWFVDSSDMSDLFVFKI